MEKDGSFLLSQSSSESVSSSKSMLDRFCRIRFLEHKNDPSQKGRRIAILLVSRYVQYRYLFVNDKTVLIFKCSLNEDFLIKKSERIFLDKNEISRFAFCANFKCCLPICYSHDHTDHCRIMITPV